MITVDLSAAARSPWLQTHRLAYPEQCRIAAFRAIALIGIGLPPGRRFHALSANVSAIVHSFFYLNERHGEREARDAVKAIVKVEKHFAKH